MTAHLEEEIERLTQRVEALEAAIAPGAWSQSVPPLTLYQTRVMRLIAKRPMTGNDALRVMSAYYPNTSDNSFDALLVIIRRVLPEAIAPMRRTRKYCQLNVPDRDALRLFLETGELPEAGRLAA